MTAPIYLTSGRNVQATAPMYLISGRSVQVIALIYWTVHLSTCQSAPVNWDASSSIAPSPAVPVNYSTPLISSRAYAVTCQVGSGCGAMHGLLHSRTGQSHLQVLLWTCCRGPRPSGCRYYSLHHR